MAALRVMPDVQGIDDQPASVEAAEVEILVERLRPHHHGRDVARNIDDVCLCSAAGLNAFDMLNHRYLVISKTELEAWLKGPSSQTDKSAKLSPLGRGASGRKDTEKTGEAA